MEPAYVLVTVCAMVMNALIAVADLAQARSVLATSAEVGVPKSWLPVLAALKIAGVVGLLAGLLGARPLGVAAAAGLVLFYLGAIGAHLRARVLYNLAFPAVFLAFALAALVLVLAH